MPLGSVWSLSSLAPQPGAFVGWGRTRTGWVQPPEEASWMVERGPCGAGLDQGCISAWGCHVSVGRSLWSL